MKESLYGNVLGGIYIICLFTFKDDSNCFPAIQNISLIHLMHRPANVERRLISRAETLNK